MLANLVDAIEIKNKVARGKAGKIANGRSARRSLDARNHSTALFLDDLLRYRRRRDKPT